MFTFFTKNSSFETGHQHGNALLTGCMALYGKKWITFSALVPALLLMLFSGFVAAQAYPGKPIKIIIPFPPGDSNDITARLIAPKLHELLGQPVIVENIPGGSGLIGLAAIARAAPDGYTIGSGQGGNLTVVPHTFKKIPYDPLNDFAPIALTTMNYQAIAANPNAPFKTLAEMISYAKANPGKLMVATNGDGGYPHLVFEDLRMRAQFTYTAVPYRGSVQATTDLMAGQVQAGILGASAFTPNIQAGKLNLLAVTNPTRPALWPNTPTAGEIVPGFSAVGWFGYVAPAGTPPAIIQKLNTAINTAMNAPEIVERMAGLGLTVMSESPAYFEKAIREDHARFGKIVKDIGFKPQ